jgi:outer membrane lipoprotein-sorting protein
MLPPSSFKEAWRASPVLLSLLASVLLVLNVACKTGSVGNNTGANPANVNSGEAVVETYATPPFQTREPERYQAQMLLKFSLDEHLESASTFISRDGDKRREDYEMPTRMKVSDLEIPAGHFLLLHDRKLYALVTPEASALLQGPPTIIPEDFAPDLLINESRTEARYQKLGVEELNGRRVTKYRVEVASAAGAERQTQIEQLIWIDEQLGMPVRSETTSTGASSRQMKYTMEMLDIKEEADQSVFALPQDYKRVPMKEILAQMGATSPLAPGDEAGSKAPGKEN